MGVKPYQYVYFFRAYPHSSLAYVQPSAVICLAHLAQLLGADRLDQ